MAAQNSISKEDLQNKLLEMKKLINQQQQIQSSLIQQQKVQGAASSGIQVRPFSVGPLPNKDGEGVLPRTSPQKQQAKDASDADQRVEEEKTAWERQTTHKFLKPTISETRASQVMMVKSPSMHQRSNSQNGEGGSSMKPMLTPVNLEQKKFDLRRSIDNEHQITLSPPSTNNVPQTRS